MMEITEQTNFSQTQGEPWGWHLLCDCSGCSRIDDEDHIRAWLDEILAATKMKLLIPPVFKQVNSASEGRGTTMIAAIETSSITYHSDDKGELLFLDIFTCKKFDPEVCFPIIEKYFKPKHLGWRFIYRTDESLNTSSILEETAALAEKSVCVLDHGLYFSLAQRLARDFRKVYYFTPYEAQGFAQAQLAARGYGYEDEGVYRTNEPLELIGTPDEPDIWVVPFCSFTDLQHYLRATGKKVWGSGEGTVLENKRWLLKEWLADHDLPVTQSILVTGTDALREELEKSKDKYVKVSTWRGDLETYHHTTWDNTQIWWAELVNFLGPLRNSMEFIIEDPINDAVESGTDNLLINGQLILPMTIGYEIKNKLYVAKVIETEAELPELFVRPLQVLAEFFADKRYANFFSTEMRITKSGEVFVTDVTTRMPSPPGCLELELWENISEIIYAGAHGEAISPIPAAKYGCELIMTSDYYSKDHTVKVSFPEKYSRWVKLYNTTKIDGSSFVLPNCYGDKDVGSIVGLSDSPASAIKAAQSIAKQVDGYDIATSDSAPDEALKTIKEGEAVGIKF